MTQLGPFELVKPAARGGMAVVWRAVHVEQRLPVAVKIMSRKLAESDKHRRAFYDEVRAVARLEHPKVVSVLDFGEIGGSAHDPSQDLYQGSPWLAMEWIDGRTLADASVWSWSRLKTVVLDILDALAHAHARGVIHRDLKPANVMFATVGDRVRVKLTDFGIARQSDADTEGDGKVRGTPNYMSPEQILGQVRDHGPWTDLYALGSMIWRIVTGEAPFQRETQHDILKAHILDRLPPFKPAIAVPDGLELFLHNLMARDPRHRFQFAADAAVSLAAMPNVVETERLVAGAFAPTIADGPTVSVPVETLSLRAADLGFAPQVLTSEIPVDWRKPAVVTHENNLVRAGLNLFPLREAPFVNRESARDQLWQSLRETARTGVSRTVVLTGGLGAGKTRLAQWLSERAHEVGGARTFWARHSPEGDNDDGIGSLVANAVGCRRPLPDDAPARVANALFGTAQLSDAERLDVYAVLKIAAPHTTLGVASDRHQTFRRMLAGLTRHRPLVLVFDDIQWGWEALELAHAIAGFEAPVLLIVTAQTEALQGQPIAARLNELKAADSVTALDVLPLTESFGRELVTRALDLEAGLAHEIAAWGGGNPLFTSQILEDLVEQRSLTLRDTGFGLRTGAEIRLPSDAIHAFDRRIEGLLRALEPSAQTTLGIAATMGNSVRRDEWEFACQSLGTHASLDLEEALLRRGLATRSPDGFSFVHPLAVEAVRRRDNAETQAQYHRVCLAALDATHRDRYEDWEGRAAHHIALGDKELAVDALMVAVERSHTQAAHGKIRALLDSAAALISDLGTPVDRAVVHALQEGRFAVGSDLDAARMWAEKALSLAPPRMQELHARGILATADRHQGRGHEAVDAFQELTQELTDPQLLARMLTDYGLALKGLGRLKDATDTFQQAAELFESFGDIYFQSRNIRYAGDAAFQRGDLDTAEAAWTLASDLALKAGDRVSVAACSNVFGELLRAKGDYEAAAISYQKASELFESAGHWGSLIADSNLGLAQFCAGRTEDARATFTAVNAGMKARSFLAGVAAAELALAACEARDENWPEALPKLMEAVRTIESATVVDRDIIDIAKWILADATQAGQPTVAGKARALVLSQLDALGLEDEAREFRHQEET